MRTPGARASPYAVFGVSRATCEYSEPGQFSDFETSDIFNGESGERQMFGGAFAGVGLDFVIGRMPRGRQMLLFGELRYARSKGAHADEFRNFDELSFAAPECPSASASDSDRSPATSRLTWKSPPLRSAWPPAPRRGFPATVDGAGHSRPRCSGRRS